MKESQGSIYEKRKYKKQGENGHFFWNMLGYGNFLHCMEIYSLGYFSWTFKLDICHLLYVKIPIYMKKVNKRLIESMLG